VVDFGEMNRALENIAARLECPARDSMAIAARLMELQEDISRELRKDDIELADVLEYQILLDVQPAFWEVKKKNVRRDLSDAELHAYRFVWANAVALGVPLIELEKAIDNAVRYGTISNPMHLIQRLAESIKAFKPAAARVVSATGYENLVLVVKSSTAALIVAEVLIDYHWRHTHKCAFVKSFSLTRECLRVLVPSLVQLVSTSVTMDMLLAACYADNMRAGKCPIQRGRPKEPEVDKRDLLTRILGEKKFSREQIRLELTPAEQAVLREPFVGKKVQQDGVHKYIQGHRQNLKPVPPAFYAVRCFGTRESSEQANKILTAIEEIRGGVADVRIFTSRVAAPIFSAFPGGPHDFLSATESACSPDGIRRAATV
jgi:hypothetical protein